MMTTADTDPAAIPFRHDWALFLDIDGTILEIAERPELVAVPDKLPTLLGELGYELGNAIALLSGRTLDSIDVLFPGLSLAASGVHGLERRTSDGNISLTPPHAGLAKILDGLNAFAADKPGLIVEDKERTVAVHFRACSDLEAEIRAHVAELISGSKGLTAIDGKMVVEIKPVYRDKGTAIRDFMATPPFFNRTPLFFGDDKTDEFGFVAARKLGGVGVRVGKPAETNAGHTLANVSATCAWLEGLRDFLAEKRIG